MIEFFDLDNQKGSASIYEAHITFNKLLFEYFKDAYRVRIGIDKDLKKVFVFLYNKDYCCSGEISESSLLKISVSKTYVRICSSSMISYIVKNFNLDIPKGSFLRYEASYDEKLKAIVINLNKGE